MPHVGEAYVLDNSGNLSIRTTLAHLSTSLDPAVYIPIRLTDGNNFYNAIGNMTATVGYVDQGLPNLLAQAWPVKLTDGAVVLGVSANPVFVTGTLFPATQAVSSSNWTPTVNQGASGSIPWNVAGNVTASVSNFPATQVVSASNWVPQITGTVSLNNVPTEYNPWIIQHPIAYRGSFGQTIAQEEVPAVNLTFHYSVNPFFVMTGTVATGFVTSSNSKAVLTPGTASNGSALLESRDAVRYVPGQGITSRFTCVFATASVGLNQEIGLGDSLDGLFFAYSGSSFGIVRRQNGTDFFISQSAWNGTDKFDGTGPSGQVVNTNKGNVYGVKFQWLGFGPLRFFIEDPGSQESTLVHTIKYSNTNDVPTLFNPTLPLRATIANVGNTAARILQTPSMGAFTEGPATHVIAPGAAGFVRSGVTGVGANVISIRNNTTFAGQKNRIRVHIPQMTVASLGGSDMGFSLILNQTLTSPSFVDFDTSTSCVSVDTAATSGSGGRVIWRSRADANASLLVDLENLNFILNPSDVLTVFAQSSAGGTSTSVDICWHELFGG